MQYGTDNGRMADLRHVAGHGLLRVRDQRCRMAVIVSVCWTQCDSSRAATLHSDVSAPDNLLNAMCRAKAVLSVAFLSALISSSILFRRRDSALDSSYTAQRSIKCHTVCGPGSLCPCESYLACGNRFDMPKHAVAATLTGVASCRLDRSQLAPGLQRKKFILND
jgi:hypothetical protein